MKKPAVPPDWRKLLIEFIKDNKAFTKIIYTQEQPTHNGRYLHWHKLRYLTPPEGLSTEQWWVGLKFARSRQLKKLPLLDTSGQPFHYAFTDQAIEYLHHMDQDAGGRIEMLDGAMANPHARDRYILHSLIEEAITSSQLEGATTTRLVAKEMIRSNRPPRDKSEQMILNNYLTMKLIRDKIKQPMSRQLILELHRYLTEKTLDDAGGIGRFRTETEEVKVFDNEKNTVLHIPPPAGELDKRIESLCDFANGKTPDFFVHPVIRAIILHFWLAYDHPFVDGNGRCARALFYWMMLNQGYWLCEFLSISNIITKGPAKYGRAYLYAENDENDMTYFILYHLDIVKRAIQELHKYIAQKVKAVRRTEELLRSSTLKLNSRQLTLLSHALRHPDSTYTIKVYQGTHRVVYQTARADLMDMVDKGLLTLRESGNAYHFFPVNGLDEKLTGR